MNNVDEVVIHVSNSSSPAVVRISPKLNRVIVNGELKGILPSTIDRLYSIIRTWKDIYNGPMVKEIEIFEITIKEGTKVSTMKGMGAYPENYSEFKSWLGDIYARNVL